MLVFYTNKKALGKKPYKSVLESKDEAGHCGSCLSFSYLGGRDRKITV
jgi:hypothetical protein